MEQVYASNTGCYDECMSKFMSSKAVVEAQNVKQSQNYVVLSTFQQCYFGRYTHLEHSRALQGGLGIVLLLFFI